VLRVDLCFRVNDPEEERLCEFGRAAVEGVNSRLDSVGLDCLKLRGLRNAVVHVLLCVVTVLLVAVAALRLGRSWKARSLSSFGVEGVDTNMQQRSKPAHGLSTIFFPSINGL